MFQSNASFERATQGDRQAASSVQSASHVTPDVGEEPRVPVLGKTLLFRGELTAEEDVILQGRVEGSIRHARNLVIGTDGSVLGDVHASHLTVEGLVEGDLHCSEAVVVRSTAQVRGNIFAPRVGIMEGAMFNGRIEMDPGAAREASPPPVRTPAKQPAVPRAPGAQGTSPRSGSAAVPARTSSSATLASPAVDQLLSTQATDEK